MSSFATIERAREAVAPVADLFPAYHPDAACIYDALDTGEASCAVRAFASTLLLAEAFPNRKLYQIDLGFDPAHGLDYQAPTGEYYIGMGHCVARLWTPEAHPLVFDSYGDTTTTVRGYQIEDYDYRWGPPAETYSEYLQIAQLESIVDEFDILFAIFTKQARMQRANETQQTKSR